MISKEEFKTLVDSVVSRTGKTQEDIALEMGYGKNYISEMTSPTGKISNKFLSAFRLKYLENPKQAFPVKKDKEGNGVSGGDDMMQILANLSESHKNLTAAHKEISESNNKLADNEKMILSRMPTAGVEEGSSLGDAAILVPLVEILAGIASGKTKYRSKEEAVAELGMKLSLHKPGKGSSGRIRSGEGKLRTG